MEVIKLRLRIFLIICVVYFLISSYLSELSYYERLLLKIVEFLGIIYLILNIVGYIKSYKKTKV